MKSNGELPDVTFAYLMYNENKNLKAEIDRLKEVNESLRVRANKNWRLQPEDIISGSIGDFL